MTRFYYDDPLAAAWQAKHFGMRFADANGGVVHCNRQMSGKYSFHPHEAQHAEYYGNLYVHPDSLPLLDVRLGDLVYTAETLHCFKQVNITELCDYLNQRGGYRVIHRDGKVFHHPHREDQP